MNRGRRHEAIFLDSKDYQTFIDLLKAVSDMFKAQIATYALMPNHYHLLLRTPDQHQPHHAPCRRRVHTDLQPATRP
jgi:REP element-mobilizing transposase RayT